MPCTFIIDEGSFSTEMHAGEYMTLMSTQGAEIQFTTVEIGQIKIDKKRTNINDKYN